MRGTVVWRVISHGEVRIISKVRYQLSSNIRVRKEAFGLLFYNTEDTNLKFIKSGSLILPEQLICEEQLNCLMEQASENHLIGSILEQLMKWGFVIEKRYDS